MSTEQFINRKLEHHMQKIEKHLDSSFDKIKNFIDKEFFIDSPISKLSNIQSEYPLPEVKQFHLIGQSEFLQKIVLEVQPLINSKIKDPVQIQSQHEHQQSLTLLQQPYSTFQQQKKNQIKFLSQLNPKPFTYQLIEGSSIIQMEECLAFSINKDCSILVAGNAKLIKIFEFKEGMLKLNQVLNEHKTNVVILKFMILSNQLISGDQGSILIWSYNKIDQWECSQTIAGHNDWIRCLILNNNEDLIISSSHDQTIKFWTKDDEWICYQTITDHRSYVHQLSLNEQQNQVISCGIDRFILVIELSECDKKWIVIQKIQVDCYGYRLCFINNNLFTFQPESGNFLHVYEMNIESKSFTKTKDITVNQGKEGSVLFSQQFIKQKQLLLNKHDKCVNLLRLTENGEFKVEQSIQFRSNYVFGQFSDDGEYLITWDNSSYEIQIRRFKEE